MIIVSDISTDALVIDETQGRANTIKLGIHVIGSWYFNSS